MPSLMPVSLTTPHGPDPVTTMSSIVAVIMVMVCTSGALLFGWWLRGQRMTLDEMGKQAGATRVPQEPEVPE